MQIRFPAPQWLRALTQTESQYRRPRRASDVLRVVYHIRHRPGFPALARIEMPKQFSVRRVRRDKCAAAISIKHQTAGRHHETASQNPAAHVRYLPRGLPRPNVERFKKLPA